MKRIFLFLAMATAYLMVSCSDDDQFTTSATAVLTFQCDTVKLDTVFANVGSRTHDFWVYNHSTRGVRLTSVRLQQGNQTGFRVNVDGSYLDNTIGSVVSDLEVRSGDSLRVFVELTAPATQQTEPQPLSDHLLFTLESGVQQTVTLTAYVWDAILMDSLCISSDTLLTSTKPIVINKGMRVDSTATLTLRSTTLYFHDKSGIDVYGTLCAEDAVFRGDRLDRMFTYLPYDRISGQWRGIRIHPSSFGNRFVDTSIRNAEYGIVCDSTTFPTDKQRLYMERSVVHNCAGPGLLAFNSWVGLLRCQFSNTQGDCVAFYGGAAIVEQCTLAQFYPFSADRGAALRFANFYGDYTYPLETMSMKRSIVTGYADDVVMGERMDGDSLTAFAYHFENSLLRTPALTDSINCIDVRWETPDDSIQGKQHFVLVDEQNLIYDFHLDSLSTAKGLGCYE